MAKAWTIPIRRRGNGFPVATCFWTLSDVELIGMSMNVVLKRVVIGGVLCWALVLGFVSCNTVRGAGEDLRATGQVIQDICTR